MNNELKQKLIDEGVELIPDAYLNNVQFDVQMNDDDSVELVTAITDNILDQVKAAPEPTLKSSEGLDLVKKLYYRLIAENNYVKNNATIKELAAIKERLSTTTPTPETASEGKIVISSNPSIATVLDFQRVTNVFNSGLCSCCVERVTSDYCKYCRNCGSKIIWPAPPTQDNQWEG